MLEAQGVRDNRLTNLAVTLDKAKYFLRKQVHGVAATPPICPLGDAEVAAFLAGGRDGVAQRLGTGALQVLRGSTSEDSRKVRGERGGRRWMGGALGCGAVPVSQCTGEHEILREGHEIL